MDNTGDGKQFPAMEEAFKEAKRVLRPGGIMVVTEGLPFALRYSLWFTQLHVEATDKWCKLFPTLDQYKAMFDKCGFNIVSKLNTLGLHWLNHYYDPEYPLREEWRSGSSYFGFTTDDEIRQIEEKCRKMIADNTIDDFIKQHDQVSEAGVLTILACKSL